MNQRNALAMAVAAIVAVAGVYAFREAAAVAERTG